jgi:Lipocalin-like domain
VTLGCTKKLPLATGLSREQPLFQAWQLRSTSSPPALRISNQARGPSVYCLHGSERSPRREAAGKSSSTWVNRARGEYEDIRWPTGKNFVSCDHARKHYTVSSSRQLGSAESRRCEAANCGGLAAGNRRKYGTDGVAKSGVAFGPNPNGRIVFTNNGQYFSLNTRPDLPKFASGNRMQGTADENKAIVQGSIGSFGTYSVSPDGKVLILKIEGSTWPSWVGIEQKRNFTVVGNEMKYTVAASIGGTSELTYKRIE